MSHLTSPPHDLKALRFVLHLFFSCHLLSLHGRGFVLVWAERVLLYTAGGLLLFTAPLLYTAPGGLLLFGIVFFLPSLVIVCFSLGFSLLFLDSGVHFSPLSLYIFICKFQDSYFLARLTCCCLSQHEWSAHPCPCVFRSFPCLCVFFFFERDY